MHGVGLEHENMGYIYIDELRQRTDKHCLWQSQPIVKIEALEQVQERTRRDQSLQMLMHIVELNKTVVCRPLLEQKGKLQHSSEGEMGLLQSRREIIKSRRALTKMYKETHQCLSVPFVFLLRSLKQLDRYGQLILTNSTAADTGEYSCWLQLCNGNKCRKDETKMGSTYIFFTGN